MPLFSALDKQGARITNEKLNLCMFCAEATNIAEQATYFHEVITDHG